MDINHVSLNFLGEELEIKATENASHTQPLIEDVNWFSSQLKNNPSQLEETYPSSFSFFSAAKHSFEKNEVLRMDAYKTLQKSSDATSNAELSMAASKIKEYHIQSLMNAKVISKMTQSIDKLTNLQ